MDEILYKEHGTELHNASFSMDKLTDEMVSFWSIAPVWPGRSSARLTGKKLEDLMSDAYLRSSDRSHLVLWMPAAELHRSSFDPMSMCGQWSIQSTIFSGHDPLDIGFVYASSHSSFSWGTKVILDTKGKHGPSSSKAVKFLLDQLVDTGGRIVDAFSHRSAVLPILARRLGMSYVGYQSSRGSYTMMVKALDQVELPGVQLEVPILASS